MLGDRIKELRLANRLSQVELGQKLGVTKQTVSNWENNNIMPSVDMLKKLAQFFSCSSDFLLELDDSGRTILFTTDLSLEQTAHIQQVLNDIQDLIRNK